MFKIRYTSLDRVVYYLNGEFHREDGPAVEYPDGEKHWFKEGKRHRLDGPAVVWLNGRESWYIHGIRDRSKKCIK